MSPALEVAWSGPLRLLPETQRRALLDRGKRALAEARVEVLPFLFDVRDNGDSALRSLTKRWDGVELEKLHLEDWEWRKIASRFPASARRALDSAARRIREFHERQLPRAYEMTLGGVRLGRKPVPLDRVGIYVPGGKASYPSTLLMAAIPAQVAGVREIAVCSPPSPESAASPALLAACEIAGVRELYTVGGAQAIFALAFGTRTIRPVQKIVGPGNVYVQAAKQAVAGQVGTDLLAGPSEVVVVADETASPDLVAWELAAQAEHDPGAVPVLLATEADLARRVALALERLLPKLGRREVIATALKGRGALLHVENVGEAIAFANEFAPEHLVLMTKNPRAQMSSVTAAGSVFLGPRSPVALGDYCAGTNHILPTSGAARFSSGLSVLDFVRFVQWQEASEAGLRTLGPVAAQLARLEGLTAHAGAVETRLRGAKGASRRSR